MARPVLDRNPGLICAARRLSWVRGIGVAARGASTQQIIFKATHGSYATAHRSLLFSIAVTLHQRERAFRDDDRAEMDLVVSRLSLGVSPAFIPLF